MHAYTKVYAFSVVSGLSTIYTLLSYFDVDSVFCRLKNHFFRSVSIWYDFFDVFCYCFEFLLLCCVFVCAIAHIWTVCCCCFSSFFSEILFFSSIYLLMVLVSFNYSLYLMDVFLRSFFECFFLYTGVRQKRQK